MKLKKEYIYLLTGFGITNLGNWVYLIALNLSVWHLTNSPAAVAGIYIIGPIARILSSFFAGSVIDRHNKRRIVIWSDIVRAIVVCLMPLFSSIWILYMLIFIANMASSFFRPSSTYLITKHVDSEHRQQFNAMNSILSSGSFMIGPALSGVIIALTNTSVAIWFNGLTFFLCAWLMWLLPNIEEKSASTKSMITLSMIRSDFQYVWQFIKNKTVLLTFFIVYTVALMIAYSLDSQEMTFLKDTLHVSDSLYGIIVGVTGIGALLGGIAATTLAKKFSVITYISTGFFLTMFCYFMFYISNQLILAVIAFVALGFFMAFSNTGYATFYQESIPTSLMGRFGSTVLLVESVVQITFTFVLGMVAEWFSIQFATTIFAAAGLILALFVSIHLHQHKTQLQWEELQ